MFIESNVKATLTLEEKRTLAEARDILQGLYSTMEEHSCRSTNYYTVLAALSQYEGEEVSMSDLETIKYLLDVISMSDGLALEV